MESYSFLLFLAIILISTKVLGLFSRKVHMPAVVGALLAGVILGPSCLNEISMPGDTGYFLELTAEIGVMLLMFSAGLETDLKKVRSLGVKSLIITSLGVIVPMLLGYLAAFTFNAVTGGSLNRPGVSPVYTEIYYGVILSATSVSITVATLKELQRLDSPVGTALISAAILDDIIGIVLLSLVISLSSSGSGNVDGSTFAGMILNATGLASNTAVSITMIVLFMILFFALSFGTRWTS